MELNNINPLSSSSIQDIIIKYKKLSDKYKSDVSNKEKITSKQILDKLNTFNEILIYIQEINDYIQIIYTRLLLLYREILPELSEIIKSKNEFIKCISLFEDRPDLSKLNNLDFLSKADIITLSTILTTTSNKNKYEIQKDNQEIKSLCSSYFDINNIIQMFYSVLDSIVIHICPNLSQLVGSYFAMKLIVYSGGIDKLVVTPACNIQVFGKIEDLKNKKGFLYYTQFVQNETEEVYKIKALRKISNKSALAVRCDYSRLLSMKNELNSFQSQIDITNNYMNIDNDNDDRKNKDGKFGKSYFTDYYTNQDKEIITNNQEQNKLLFNFKDQIQDKIHKLKTIKEKPTIKPLPKPEDKPRKKRGGRKLRKYKQDNKMSKTMKEKMRLKFNDYSNEVNDYLYNNEFGMIGMNKNEYLSNSLIEERQKNDFLGKKKKLI